jgi:jasmonic acid-amino synthetase
VVVVLVNFGLNERSDPESFKAYVPLAKDLEPFIYRISDGDDSPILTGKPITTMSLRYYFALLLLFFLLHLN